MATRILSRSLLTKLPSPFSSAAFPRFHLRPISSSATAFARFRLRSLASSAAYATLRRDAFFPVAVAVRGFASRTTSSSLNDPNPNWSNRPPKETILLDGCDFEHWLVVLEKPEGDPTRDEIIDSYIKTLAMVVGSEEEARMKIYSVSTRHYFAFGALVSEELSYKIKELPKVRWVLPDSYLDVRNKDYGGEPFINGQAVPYDPKYHEEWVRNNARAQDRNKRNDRPRNFDRSRNFERRRENMQNRDFENRGPPPPNTPPPQVVSGPNMSPPPTNFPPQNAPQSNMPRNNYSPLPPHSNVPQNNFPPQNNYPPQGNYPPHHQGNYPSPPNNFQPQNSYPPPQNNMGNFPQPNMGTYPQNTNSFPPQNNMRPPQYNNAGRAPTNDAGPAAYPSNFQNNDFSGNGPQANAEPNHQNYGPPTPGFGGPDGGKPF
uniref:MORF/ORRM1/DAG-like MORF domain-containing protein n=1 Tax=Kalanchoe fedtschenkoi TaxID=63787 RepID=A0A7N0SZ53_KALFE